MMRSAEHVTWDVYMATGEARAWVAEAMRLFVAAFVPIDATFRRLGKAAAETRER